MKPVLDETHDPDAQSWVESANAAGTDFPIQNLPFGVFQQREADAKARVGVAIGDRVLDIIGLHSERLLAEPDVVKKGVPVASGPNRFLVIVTGGH
jgi:fumarylacetoacetase